MTAVLDGPLPRELHRSGFGGRPARRAVLRWAWRLYKREWRQQILTLALLTLAVAATTLGLAVAINTPKPATTTFTLPGNDAHLAADIAAFRSEFHQVQVAFHTSAPIPGSTASIDVRALEGSPGQGSFALRLLSGSYPSGSGEVAMTRGVAQQLGLSIGDTWHDASQTRRLVGLVQNPRDFDEQFALVGPGQVSSPDKVTIQTSASRQQTSSFRPPSGTPVEIDSASPASQTATDLAVLALATLGLVFVGLLATAGFAVMAHRRLRALGMLGAIGATDGQVRLVLLANGAAVGISAAIVGAATGLVAWAVLAPHLQTQAGHTIRIDHLPVTAIVAAMVLAGCASVAAAWWPARAAARIPVVSAISGRPPRPQPVHISTLLGVLLIAGGLALIGLSDQTHAPLLVAGMVTSVVGLLLMAPLAIRTAAGIGKASPIGVRIALRDLVRYQARSSAALGAITLAVLIATTITVSAARQTEIDSTATPNLPTNELAVYLSPGGVGGLVPDYTAAQLDSVESTTARIALTLGTSNVLQLDKAIDPSEPLVSMPGGNQSGRDAAALLQVQSRGQGTQITVAVPLYVATNQVLSHYGIRPDQVDPSSQVLTSKGGLSDLQLGSGGSRNTIARPAIQVLKGLPVDGSQPTSLITESAARQLGLTATPAAWLIRTDKPLTAAQVRTASDMAAAAGLVVEAPGTSRSLDQVGRVATGVGLLLALGVLVMTVGLIRSETSGELRTLTATGASGRTRRTLTSATAGTLAILGAVIGTVGAYIALAAWYHSDLSSLKQVPYAELALILLGLPCVASIGGWLLGGREPKALGRRPMA